MQSDLGSTSHSVSSSHSPGSNIAQSPQLVLSVVVHAIIAPGVEEHLPIAVQSQVHLNLLPPAHDEVTHSRGLGLGEWFRSSVGFYKDFLENLFKLIFSPSQGFVLAPLRPQLYPQFLFGSTPLQL